MCLDGVKSGFDLSVEEIDLLMSVETDIKVYKKLFYFRLRALGHSAVNSCNLTGVKERTGYYWDKLWKNGGYNAILPKPSKGREPKLNKEQVEELGNDLEKKDKWLVNDVLKLVKKKYNIEYTYYGLQCFLKDHYDIEFENYFERQRNEQKNLEDLTNESFKKRGNKKVEEVINLIKKEKDAEVLKRLNYILFKVLGVSTEQASYFIGVTVATGNNWWKRWANNGYNGLKRKPGQGCKPKLNTQQEKILKKKPRTTR